MMHDGWMEGWMDCNKDFAGRESTNITKAYINIIWGRDQKKELQQCNSYKREKSMSEGWMDG